MEGNSVGLKIEGFAVGALRRTFGGGFDRHHPYVSWATATVSGSFSSFNETKEGLKIALKGVQHVLHQEGGREGILNDLAVFESAIEESSSLSDIESALDENKKIIDVALSG